MLFTIQFLNPISLQNDYIKYDFDKLSYVDWQLLNCKFGNNNPISIINHLLKWHSAKLKGFNFETDYTGYCYEKQFVLPVLYGLLRINNPFDYNETLRRIIDVHKENIIIYDSFNNISKPTKVKKSKLKNKFYRQEQPDIFGKIKYIYINPKTNEQFESDNPNLLDELNKPKRRIKTTVPISSMTFSFKKK